MERWKVTLHCCRYCMGRVIVDEPLFRCASCGAECREEPDGICGCGIRPRDGTVRAGRFLCIPNPQKSEASPQEVVIAFLDTPPPARAAPVTA